MDLGLKGLNVPVTGGSKGSGRRAAGMFAAEGANVSICARNADEVARTVAKLDEARERLKLAADVVRARLGQCRNKALLRGNEVHEGVEYAAERTSDGRVQLRFAQPLAGIEQALRRPDMAVHAHLGVTDADTTEIDTGGGQHCLQRVVQRVASLLVPEQVVLGQRLGIGHRRLFFF